MSNLLIHVRSGQDSKLHLEVPVGTPNAEFEVEVAVRPTSQLPKAWPPNYFDLFGSISDTTFGRPPQGEWPAPVQLP